MIEPYTLTGIYNSHYFYNVYINPFLTTGLSLGGSYPKIEQNAVAWSNIVVFLKKKFFFSTIIQVNTSQMKASHSDRSHSDSDSPISELSVSSMCDDSAALAVFDVPGSDWGPDSD